MKETNELYINIHTNKKANDSVLSEMSNFIDWDAAEKWLKEIESMYSEIGSNGYLALLISIRPLRDRFNTGERTEELYNDIMNLQ